MRSRNQRFCIRPSAVVASVVLFVGLSSVGSLFGPTLSGLAHADESIKGELDRIESLPSRFERKLALYELVADMEEETLGDYFDYLETVDASSFSFELESLIVEKWAAINPKEAVARIESLPELRARKLLGKVFEEWSLSNLSSVVEFTNQWSNYRKQAVFESILLSRPNLTDEQKLSIAKQLGIESTASSIIAKVMKSAPITNLVDTWKSFYEANKGNFASVVRNERQFLRAILDGLVAELGSEAFSLVDASVMNEDDRVRILPLIAFPLAEIDPERAYSFVSDLKRDEAFLCDGVVYIWAKKDPIKALEAVSSIASRDKRISLQEIVLSEWVNWSDPEQILESAHALPESARTLAQEFSINAMANLSPEGALERTLEVADISTRDRLETSIISIWAKQDVDAALAWVRSELSVQRKRHYLLDTILKELVRSDRDLALRTALDEPADSSDVGLEASVIREIAKSSPDAALRLIDKARNQQTTRLGMLSIGGKLLQSGGKRNVDKAMKLAQRLESDEDRHRYLQALMVGFLHAGQLSELYERIDEFPTPELRMSAAQMLKSNQGHSLTSEQLKQLDSYLIDDAS